MADRYMLPILHHDLRSLAYSTLFAEAVIAMLTYDSAERATLKQSLLSFEMLSRHS